MTIYDRYGMLVYNGTNELENNGMGWDGRLNGTLLEQGVYTYVTTLEMDDGLVRQFSGSVMLFR